MVQRVEVLLLAARVACSHSPDESLRTSRSDSSPTAALQLEIGNIYSTQQYLVTPLPLWALNINSLLRTMHCLLFRNVDKNAIQYLGQKQDRPLSEFNLSLVLKYLGDQIMYQILAGFLKIEPDRRSCRFIEKE